MEPDSASQAPSGGQMLLRGAARQLNEGQSVAAIAAQLSPRFDLIDVMEAELLLTQPGVAERLAGYEQLRLVVDMVEARLAGGRV